MIEAAAPVDVPAVPPLDVSVVVCCYTDRRRPEILAAVGSVQRQTVAPAEIIVVVDHNPGLFEWLSPRLSGVRVVVNTHSRGLTGARNTGVEAGRGDIVAFLDDDATADPRWLAALLAEYAADDVVAVGGRIDPVWTGSRPDWFPDEFDWVVGCSYRGLPTTRADVRNVIGANMSFRRHVVVQVGGFRQELGRMGALPAGCEETELCIRATASTAGRVVYQPAALVAHNVPQDRGAWSYFRARCFAEGMSKSVVARLSGTDAALASERAYVRRTLPAGVARSLRDGCTQRSPGGFGRAGAIVAGFTLTAAGYALGRVRSALRTGAGARSAPGEDDFAGVWCGECELSGEPKFRAVATWSGQPTTRVLTRMHGRPLGYVTVPSAGGRPDTAELTRLARASFADRIAEHLAADGLPQPDPDRPLPATGAGCSERVAADVLVSVVVCTRARSAILGRCLAALRELTYPHVEIIIVDNAPTEDSTKSVVTEFRSTDDRVRYVVEPEPGLSRARNRGLQEARGSIVAYTDDDVVVDPEWLQGVVRGFRRRPDVGCVTGLICTTEITNPTEAYFDARVASWSTRMSDRLFDLRDDGGDGPLYPYTVSMFGAGANCAFDRSFLLESHGFDEALGAGSRTRGGEDIDKFVSTVLHGRAIAYEPSAIVWHRHRAERRELLRQMFGYGTGLTAFVAKHLAGADTRGHVLRRVPQGLSHLLRIRARTGVALAGSAPPPRGAAVMEMLGHLAGPFLYLRARRDVRRATEGAPAPGWRSRSTSAGNGTEP